jgi:hypothetical protein
MWRALLLLIFGVGVQASGIPLPPPPTLPPAAPQPFLVIAGPTVGAVCGTASLVVLLTPSLSQGYLHVPFDEIIDPHTLNAYAGTALYLCGFIPSPLTPTECSADVEMLDALRGLNPLAAQVVGLFPEGATIDTILDVEQLLPSGPTLVGPAVATLSKLMDCHRSAGAPPTLPPIHSRPTHIAPPVVSTTSVPSEVVVPRALPSVPVQPAIQIPGAVTVTAPSSVQIFTRNVSARTGLQVLGFVLGGLLIVVAIAGWLWSRAS